MKLQYFKTLTLIPKSLHPKYNDYNVSKIISPPFQNIPFFYQGYYKFLKQEKD